MGKTTFSGPVESAAGFTQGGVPVTFAEGQLGEVIARINAIAEHVDFPEPPLEESGGGQQMQAMSAEGGEQPPEEGPQNPEQSQMEPPPEEVPPEENP